MAASLYDRLGGDQAINAAVELFYEKALADKRIRHFFEGMDINRIKNHQRAFLSFATGGDVFYHGKNMKSAHAHLVESGLTDMHFDAVLENLAEALQELQVSQELISETAQVAEATRDVVLGRVD